MLFAWVEPGTPLNYQDSATIDSNVGSNVGVDAHQMLPGSSGRAGSITVGSRTIACQSSGASRCLLMQEFLEYGTRSQIQGLHTLPSALSGYQAGQGSTHIRVHRQCAVLASFALLFM